MEWIDGVKLTDTKAMSQRGLSIVDFVDVGIECSLRQLLAENGGFFHADPHPGPIPHPSTLPLGQSNVSLPIISTPCCPPLLHCSL